MCQAYEGERNSILSSENYACIKGFTAAKSSKPKTNNPYYSGYEYEAWNNGWECYQERILPWALERHYHAKGDISGGAKARNYFKRTGKLTKKLEKLLPKN